ncbi:MAG: hypothetical protein NVSMB65_21070 [Chloroflexota bacterium]
MPHNAEGVTTLEALTMQPALAHASTAWLPANPVVTYYLRIPGEAQQGRRARPLWAANATAALQ